MNRLIFTRRRSLWRAVLRILGAVALIAAALALMLAYFDVLTKCLAGEPFTLIDRTTNHDHPIRNYKSFGA